jgi:ATP-dependent protease Clp ATPase subunit
VLFKRTLECSFCGKSATQVAKLVAGHRGYICDVCAAEAHRIMSEGDDPAQGTTRRRAPSLVVRIRRLLSQLSGGGASRRLSELSA